MTSPLPLSPRSPPAVVDEANDSSHDADDATDELDSVLKQHDDV